MPAVLPFIVTLVLWAHGYREGDAHPAWKWAVLALALSAVRLRFFSGERTVWLVAQVVLAIGMLVWNRRHDARLG